jgi:stalled ribosome rescue protein Dom34
MKTRHSVVWLDHQEARVFGVDADRLQAETVAAPEHHLHRHPKGATAEHQHPSDSAHFFQDVATVLRDADQVLVLGPSTAKLQFLRFLAKQDHALEAKIVGVETVDHPTDRQLVAHARHYFDPKNYPRGA